VRQQSWQRVGGYFDNCNSPLREFLLIPQVLVRRDKHVEVGILGDFEQRAVLQFSQSRL
jgi:hypothetical protein